MALPLVSIIIPCFRQGHFLEATVRSALSQSYPAIEIVIVNDGSDDNTEEVARSFAGQVEYVSQQNAGLPAARNRGIRHARGKYLLFLDSDDMLEPDSVRWLVDAAADRENVLCVMGHRFFGSDMGGCVGPEKLPPREGSLSVSLLTGNFGPPHSYLSPRVVVERLGLFDTSFKSCEDWDLWSRLTLAGAQIVPVYRAGALYRRHAGSMSRNDARMAITRAQVLRRTATWFREGGAVNPMDGVSTREARKRVQRELVRELLAAGYFLREKGEFVGSLRSFLASMRFGCTSTALAGICKLVAHQALSRAREKRLGWVTRATSE